MQRVVRGLVWLWIGVRVVQDLVAPKRPAEQRIVIELPNGREMMRLVTQEALNAAARGPSSLVGGSLITGRK